MLDKNGFKRITYDEWVEKQIERAKTLFGNNIVTTEQSVLGKFIRLTAYDLATAHEELEATYYARFPHTATGASLDRLTPFAGISRNAPTYAVYEVEFTGTPEYTIPLGFIVGTEDGKYTFHTLKDVTIGANGKCVVHAECDTYGTSGNIDASRINTIINPDADVSSVSCMSCVYSATDEETDEELRERFDSTVAGIGSSTYDSIVAAIMRVNGVQGVVVMENDTDETVGDMPPHSFACIVYAPERLYQAVGDAIFSKKPMGIQCVGDTSVEVLDASGKYQTVRFFKVTEVPVYVNVRVTVNGDFGAKGITTIKEAIAEKINQLYNGQDVVLVSLYAPVLSVEGVTDATITMKSSASASFTGTNITVTEYQAARCSVDNITVTTEGGGST